MSFVAFLAAFLFFPSSGCRKQHAGSQQKFWDPEEDSLWQEKLAAEEGGGTRSSQEGEKLFKQNCASCHFTDKDMTGPALKGARERWKEHSSEEQFYAFIKNSKQVIDGGDPYARELYSTWEGTNMIPHQLTNEQIDEIFLYVEGGY